MRKTHTFLENLPQSLSIEKISSVNWSTLLTRLQNSQTDHIIISDGDENEKKFQIVNMRGRTQEGERCWDLREALVCSVRGERKKRAKMKFSYRTDNIIFLRDKRATVTV